MKSVQTVILLVALLLAGASLMTTSRPVQAAPDAQPEMRAAMEHLREARRNLESASRDKGGHRAKAIEHIQQAIAEVELGIKWDNQHRTRNERH